MSEDVRKVRELLKSGRKFWLDTNVFVNLAEAGHDGHELLKNLAAAKFQLVFFEENEHELAALIKHRSFSHHVKHELQHFLDDVDVVKGMPHAQHQVYADRLARVEPLVPRQLAYDELLSEDKDSFVSRILHYVEEYGRDPVKAAPHLKTIAREMKNIKDRAKELMFGRAEELIDELDLDEDRLRKGHYFDSVEKMAHNTVTELKKAFEKHGMNLVALRSAVDEMRKKNHAVDKRFAAHVVAQGLTCHSNDDDVLMLLLLHSSMEAL